MSNYIIAGMYNPDAYHWNGHKRELENALLQEAHLPPAHQNNRPPQFVTFYPKSSGKIK
jgi:hypothetical protein